MFGKVTSTLERGDKLRADRLSGRRVTLSRRSWSGEQGFTLIELVITIAVLTILTLGVVPLMKVSVKRQKEQQLRESLRTMRRAIDEFRRDTTGMRCTGLGAPGAGTGAPGQGTIEGGGGPRPNAYVDPRSKVVV